LIPSLTDQTVKDSSLTKNFAVANLSVDILNLSQLSVAVNQVKDIKVFHGNHPQSKGHLHHTNLSNTTNSDLLKAPHPHPHMMEDPLLDL